MGEVHYELENRPDDEIQKSLVNFGKQLGFLVNGGLREIEKDLALKIVKLVLSEDLAYKDKIKVEDGD